MINLRDSNNWIKNNGFSFSGSKTCACNPTDDMVPFNDMSKKESDKCICNLCMAPFKSETGTHFSLLIFLEYHWTYIS